MRLEDAALSSHLEGGIQTLGLFRDEQILLLLLRTCIAIAPI